MSVIQHATELLPSGEIVIDGQVFSPEEVKGFVETVPIERQKELLSEYGITPEMIVAAYNKAKGSNYTVKDAYKFYGMEPPQSASAIPEQSVPPVKRVSSAGTSSSGSNVGTSETNAIQHATELLPSGEIVIDGQVFSPEEVKQFVEAVPVDQQKEILIEYGIPPEYIATAYNIATGSNYSPEDAYKFYGMEPPQSASASSGSGSIEESNNAGARLLPNGGIMINNQIFTPEQVKEFVETVPLPQQREILIEYGIPPEYIATAYNIATGSNYSPEDAYSFYQIEEPKDEFKIPEDRYPTKTSSSSGLTESGFDWSGAAGQYVADILSKSSPGDLTPVKQSGSEAYSGMDWENPLASALIPQLVSKGATDLIPTTTSSTLSKAAINWGAPVVSEVAPILTNVAKRLPSVAKNIGQILQQRYSNLMRQALQPEAFQGTLNTLASKGLLNSSIAGTALGATAKGIATDIANKAYESALQSELAKMQVPSALADIVGLGKETTSTSQSFSKSPTDLLSAIGSLSKITRSTSTSTATDPASLLSALGSLGKKTTATTKSTGMYQDPLAPYQLMAGLL